MNDDFLPLPKIDLHRHLEGSVRLETLQDIAVTNDLDVPRDLDTIRRRAQVTADDPRTSHNFLSKFHFLRHFFCSAAVVERIFREAIADAARDGLVYLELRFTPQALSQASGLSLRDVMAISRQTAQAASADYALPLKLIASVNRHESVSLAAEVLSLVLAEDHEIIVGYDLAGDERNYPAEPFKELFARANAAGLVTTVHAGEWDGAQSVAAALEQLKPQRIGHGVRAVEDAGLLSQLAERGTVLEVCPTSNVLSGVCTSFSDVPFTALTAAGVKFTLNTDDPSVCDVTLSDELRRYADCFGADLQTIRQLQLQALDAAFVSDSERAAIRARL